MMFDAGNDQLIKLKTIAGENGVSLRTVQNDISAINEEGLENGFQIVSFGSKGSRMCISDEDAVSRYRSLLTKDYNNRYYFNEQSSRVYYILMQLLNSASPIKTEDFAEQMYISKSRISSDLNYVKEILKKYDLTLVSKPYHGCTIEGREIDKRRCIVKENLSLGDYRLFAESPEQDAEVLQEVRDIVTPILNKYQFKISDIALQNLIIHIQTSVARIKTGHAAEDKIEGLEADSSYESVMEISQEIMEDCSEKFDFPLIHSEVVLLAYNLYGKQIVDQDKYISEEIDSRIVDALTTLSDFYNIDFVNDLNLRISLALHIMPLEARLATGMTLKNIMTYQIKRSYAFAFDIATAFTSIVFARYMEHISDDEISYITLHFMVALDRYYNLYHKVKVLLICHANTTNTLLVSQRLRQWFPKIRKIDIIPASQVKPMNFSSYNAVLTTDDNIVQKYPGSVKKIKFFLNNSDYQGIESAINGITGSKDILDKFDKSIFYYGNAKDKYDIIRILFEKAQKTFHLNEEYYNSVLVHESYASSWFGNDVAVPHAEKPVSEDSFVAVGILKKPIAWDGTNKVQFVFLVSIGNQSVYNNQLWYYLSDIISSHDAHNEMLEDPTFENFMKILKNIYKHLD